MALKAAADVDQAAAYVNLGVKAITDVKKSAKATADVKPLKIEKRPKSSWQLCDFSVKFFTENHVFSSPAMSDLQAMNYEVYKNMKLTLNINFTLAFASILSIVSIISSVSFSSLSNLSSKVFWEIVNLLMTSALSLETPLKEGQFINEVYILGQNVPQNFALK